MEKTHRKGLPCYVALLIITLAAGLVLGATYTLTKEPIEVRQAEDAEAARKSVLPEAESFEEVAAPEGLDWLYLGIAADGSEAGYAAQITTTGFGGEIEIIAGVNTEGTLTGISVGGSNFSETAGLGAKSKEPEFTSQFAGKTAPLTVVKAGEEKGESTIDAITSASITSKAVTNAVNNLCALINGEEVDAVTSATQAEGGAEE